MTARARTGPTPLKPRAIFVTKFFVAMLALYAVVAFNPVNDRVIVPFTGAVARSSALLLRAAGTAVGTAGTVIRSQKFALDVENGCNGVEAVILLVAAIAAFPATLRSRLMGLTVSIVAIELLNLVRLSSLFWLGEHYPRVFDLFHVAVWQSLIILAAISIFVLWSWKFAEKPLVKSR